MPFWIEELLGFLNEPKFGPCNFQEIHQWFQNQDLKQVESFSGFFFKSSESSVKIQPQSSVQIFLRKEKNGDLYSQLKPLMKSHVHPSQAPSPMKVQGTDSSLRMSLQGQLRGQVKREVPSEKMNVKNMFQNWQKKKGREQSLEVREFNNQRFSVDKLCKPQNNQIIFSSNYFSSQKQALNAQNRPFSTQSTEEEYNFFTHFDQKPLKPNPLQSENNFFLPIKLDQQLK